jgi:hypothetical protein
MRLIPHFPALFFAHVFALIYGVMAGVTKVCDSKVVRLYAFTFPIFELIAVSGDNATVVVFAAPHTGRTFCAKS